LAERHPEKTFVAIEFLKRRHFKLARRVDKRGLTNVLLVQGRAQVVIPRVITCATFDRAYVLYPDPWPKDRHIPHRLMTADFMSILACVVRPGGDLIFATDFIPYAEWVVANSAEVPAFEGQGDPYLPVESIPDYEPTFYEQKWREEGREFRYLRFLRNDRPVSRSIEEHVADPEATDGETSWGEFHRINTRKDARGNKTPA
jgi:tRNA (guanine-N7-)-methyltransferase